MQTEKLLNALSEAFKESGEKFSEFLWRENIGEMIESQKRYSRLVEWIERQIDICMLRININTPANKSEDYTNGKFSDYLEDLKDVALLVNCKELLKDERTSREQRGNIEYTLGKIYGVHYSEYLEDYV